MKGPKRADSSKANRNEKFVSAFTNLNTPFPQIAEKTKKKKVRKEKENDVI
jgi:hypothetical protein